VSWRDLARAYLQHGFELGQFGFVLVGVVLAEEKLSPGRERSADPSCGTAAIAPVRSS